ncbi:hypothetical protein AGLY_003426 [Aphis glycines]|uniref:Uncharacterized protein n=1 Tax=Aphis glycines TaxID=307491 RepID=A0A6G0U0Z9_APHGL|nr:hypothetical protein AGLY_003426 [Aphis glycines]
MDIVKWRISEHIVILWYTQRPDKYQHHLQRVSDLYVRLYFSIQKISHVSKIKRNCWAIPGRFQQQKINFYLTISLETTEEIVYNDIQGTKENRNFVLNFQQNILKIESCKENANLITGEIFKLHKYKHLGWTWASYYNLILHDNVVSYGVIYCDYMMFSKISLINDNVKIYSSLRSESKSEYRSAINEMLGKLKGHKPPMNAESIIEYYFNLT